MANPPPELRRAIVRFLILLPAAYAVWYVAGSLWLVPVAHLTDAVTGWLYPNTVQQVLQDNVFLFVLVDPSISGGLPVAELKADSRSYGVFKIYTPPLGSGIPLFWALALALAAPPLRRLFNLLLGSLVLMAGQVTSIVVKMGATLFSQVPAFRPSNAICSADCYWALLFPVQYFTYLILPTLLAVLTWAILYRTDLRRLIDRRRLERDSPGQDELSSDPSA